MRNKFVIRRFAASAMIAAMMMLPLTTIAQQTRIKVPSNKYKVQDDVRLGGQAAGEIERQFPILNDHEATEYLERVGQRLVEAIPREFNQPAFDYRFKLVNARDLNAFALPGGPMYVNRGMIESARNEGEMAGVMAHEISHIALRHATAQATKQSSAKNMLGTIGLIFGGAVVGGQAGAQLGGLLAQGWMTKYSREYESQADMLGAQIMANAGYDPRDLANVFRTIQQERSGGGPEWLSSHPDPGNRYEKIIRESAYLRVSHEPIKLTRDFERIQSRFRGMPRAASMAEIQRGYSSGRGSSSSPTSYGQYSSRVAAPSPGMRSYSTLNWIRMNVPENWRDFTGQDSVQFAPEGAYGQQGITRGLMVGMARSEDRDLQRDSQAYVNEVLQGNSYLRQQSGFSPINISGRRGYMTTAAGRSPVTGQAEIVTIYTTQLRNGDLVYVITVVPDQESYAYNSAFRNVLSSIRFYD